VNDKSEGLPSLVLRLNDLRAGDVLLTRGAGFESSLIKAFSGGTFSHSALCTTPHTIFESDGENVVGNKILKIIAYAHSRHETIPLGKVPGKAARCAVYRHPEMTSVSPDRFAKVLKQTMTMFYGRDYSYMCRLGRLAKTNSLFRWGIRKYCDFKDRRLGKDALPSVFCSELVAYFYSELGLSLFTEPRLAHDISPNDLANSRLELVAGAVVDPATLENVRIAGPQENSLFKALETHDPVASYNKGILLNKVAVTEFEEAITVKNREMLADTSEKFGESLDEVMTHFNQCEAFRHAGCLRRAQRLAQRWTALANAMPDLLNKALSYNAAATKTMFREIRLANRSLFRCRAILQSAMLRFITKGGGFWKRRRLLRTRRATLNHARWVSSLDVRLQADMDKVIESIKAPQTNAATDH
jgi:hypothetical protein